MACSIATSVTQSSVFVDPFGLGCHRTWRSKESYVDARVATPIDVLYHFITLIHGSYGQRRCLGARSSHHNADQSDRALGAVD